MRQCMIAESCLSYMRYGARLAACAARRAMLACLCTCSLACVFASVGPDGSCPDLQARNKLIFQNSLPQQAERSKCSELTHTVTALKQKYAEACEDRDSIRIALFAALDRISGASASTKADDGSGRPEQRGDLKQPRTPNSKNGVEALLPAGSQAEDVRALGAASAAKSSGRMPIASEEAPRTSPGTSERSRFGSPPCSSPERRPQVVSDMRIAAYRSAKKDATTRGEAQSEREVQDLRKQLSLLQAQVVEAPLKMLPRESERASERERNGREGVIANWCTSTQKHTHTHTHPLHLCMLLCDSSGMLVAFVTCLLPAIS
jgi:hypothetical protein